METNSMEYRILAGIAYLFWPISLIIICTSYKKSRFLRFHGYQAFFLGIILFVIYLVLGAFLQVVPFLGPLIYKLLIVGQFLFLVLLGYRCLLGELFRVPLIYDLAQGVME